MRLDQTDANLNIHPAMRTCAENPAAYSRHTLTLGLGAPFEPNRRTTTEPGPSATKSGNLSGMEGNGNGNGILAEIPQQQQQQELVHPFFKQSNRLSLSRRSRASADHSAFAAEAAAASTAQILPPNLDQPETTQQRTAIVSRSGMATPATVGLGLDFSSDFASGLEFAGLPPPYKVQDFTLDLNAVNERLLNGGFGSGRGMVETGFDGEEFGWLGGVVM